MENKNPNKELEFEQPPTSDNSDIYSGIKEGEAKLAIIIWFLYGAFALFTGRMHGIVTLILFFLVGMFVASFAAIPTYLLQQLIARGLAKRKASYETTTAISLPLTLVKILWICLVARYYLILVNGI